MARTDQLAEGLIRANWSSGLKAKWQIFKFPESQCAPHADYNWLAYICSTSPPSAHSGMALHGKG